MAHLFPQDIISAKNNAMWMSQSEFLGALNNININANTDKIVSKQSVRLTVDIDVYGFSSSLDKEDLIQTIANRIKIDRSMDKQVKLTIKNYQITPITDDDTNTRHKKRKRI